MKTMKNSRQRGVLALLGWAMAGSFLTLGFCSCGGGKSSEENPFAFAQVESLTCDSIPIAEILQPSVWTVVGTRRCWQVGRTTACSGCTSCGVRVPVLFRAQGGGALRTDRISLMRDASQQGVFVWATRRRSFLIVWTRRRQRTCAVSRWAGVQSDDEGRRFDRAGAEDAVFHEEVRYEYYTVNTRSGQGVDTVRALLSKASLQLSERGMAVANLYTYIYFARRGFCPGLSRCA